MIDTSLNSSAQAFEINDDSIESRKFDMAQEVLGKYLTEVKKLNNAHSDIDAMALEHRVYMLS